MPDTSQFIKDVVRHIPSSDWDVTIWTERSNHLKGSVDVADRQRLTQVIVGTVGNMLPDASAGAALAGMFPTKRSVIYVLTEIITCLCVMVLMCGLTAKALLWII